ncbi:MAG: DUF5685 family protein [Faecalibacterium sp.]|nr:DUF5685 family protein [Ruminococcus sp.]MCM1391618.1 DUF5685 family protein [Ruminococcus sp.]MCM1484920.1 DUF5685 family protein [Faecalibacterium sp.]
MFGYVRVNKPEMKVKEYEAYRGLYCTLCKYLGKEYGVISRLMLSYDLTFLAMIILSVQGVSPEFKGGRCPFNPMKKCNYCTNAENSFSFAAAVTVIMFYYKIKDNIADSGIFKKFLMYLILPYAALKRRKAKKCFDKLDLIIGESMQKQSEVEQNETDILDKAAHNSADALGRIFCYNDEENTSLYRLGYMLGRWVYLIDAADDIESDIKHSSFNVFVNRYNLKTAADISDEIKKEIESTLNLSVASAIEAYNNLKLTVLFPIIENILFDGMSGSMNKVLKGKNK